MTPITEPIRVKMVTVRAIRAKYYVSDHVVRVGEESEFPVADAERLVKAGWAEIVPGTERIVTAGYAPPDPPAARRWSASKW